MRRKLLNKFNTAVDPISILTTCSSPNTPTGSRCVVCDHYHRGVKLLSVCVQCFRRSRTNFFLGSAKPDERSLLCVRLLIFCLLILGFAYGGTPSVYKKCLNERHSSVKNLISTSDTNVMAGSSKSNLVVPVFFFLGSSFFVLHQHPDFHRNSRTCSCLLLEIAARTCRTFNKCRRILRGEPKSRSLRYARDLDGLFECGGPTPT